MQKNRPVSETRPASLGAFKNDEVPLFQNRIQFRGNAGEYTHGRAYASVCAFFDTFSLPGALVGLVWAPVALKL